MHALQHAMEAKFFDTPEVARFLEPQDTLNGQLNHNKSADHDQHGDQAPLRGQGFDFSVSNGADRDQDHPEAISPIPALRKAVAARSSNNQRGESAERTSPGSRQQLELCSGSASAAHADACLEAEGIEHLLLSE